MVYHLEMPVDLYASETKYIFVYIVREKQVMETFSTLGKFNFRTPRFLEANFLRFFAIFL